MINRYLYILFSVFFIRLLSGQTLPLKQSFEGTASDSWNYTTNPAAFNAGGNVWDRVDSSGYISGASDGTWFWESQDADVTGYLTFETLDISGEGSLQITFDYYASSGYEEVDGIGYEIIYDNDTSWDSATLVEFDDDTGSTWEQAVVNVPANADYLRFRLWIHTSAGTEYGGVDNIELKEAPLNQPSLEITSPEYGLKVENGVSSLTVSGTCTNCVGDLVWSNGISGVAGSIAATNDWDISDLPIIPTNNVIIITGTNSAGEAASDEIVIYREFGLALAFTAFNASRDAFAFVALTEIAADTDIIFTDEEWDGTSFGGGEADIIWNSGNGVDAGRVVVIDHCDDDTSWSANYGSIDPSSDQMSLAATSAEDIYVYLGAAREPVFFLTEVSNAGGELDGTGLEYGIDAVDLSENSEYTGPRSGFDTYMEYLTLLCAPSNWSALSSAPDSTTFIVNGASPVPMLSIESPEDGNFYEYGTSVISVSGTTANVAGYISWSNETSGASGEITAADDWVIDSVSLAAGAENIIAVTATNSAGESASDSIEISRGNNLSTDSAGIVAFTSFNSVTDSFSFVVLENIDAGTVIRFTDEEWDGLEFGTGEDDIIWSNSVATAAGTVVTVKDCDDEEGIHATVGFIDGEMSLSQSGEDIYAYFGDAKREPTAFLAAVSTGTGELRGTGLAFGQTAVDIEQNPKSQYYSGVREGKTQWTEYPSLINNAANWSGTEGVTETWGDETAFRRKKEATVIFVQ